jgi:hypothetical protein
MRIRRSLLSIVTLSSALIAFTTDRAAAQASPTAPAPAVQRPPAAPADVASPDAIIAALYDVISGPAGQKRNWDRMRSLFVPGARLIPTGVAQDGTARHRLLDVEDYIKGSGRALEERGFFERELSRKMERFGNIVHAFSTYDSKAKLEDEKPFARGINSIQLLNDGTRWWIVNVFWDSERANNPIPAEYLPKQ